METKCIQFSASLSLSKPPPKLRIEASKWQFSKEDYVNQIQLMTTIRENKYTSYNILSKTTIQQINKKISGYKQQDLHKHLFNKDKFIYLSSIVDKMIECNLHCYYCLQQMDVLYDISREMTQWTVDRIDNNLGHNYDNYCLACLGCNLKRRRKNDDKFLFTQQLKLVKME